jgi:CO/xanthine dehydrogenase FAD-binding subunit
MLINLQAIIQPESLADAQKLLAQLGVYPLYGGGASLIRLQSRDIHEAVDLSGVVSPKCETVGADVILGAGATLADVAAFDASIGGIIRAEWPITLQNALTVGDVLLEGTSLLLTLLHGLGARIDTPDRGADDKIEVVRWAQMAFDERRQHVIQSVIIPRYASPSIRFALEKVSRTPADVPIVAAIGFAFAIEPDPGAYAFVHGVAPYPVRFTPGMGSQLGDYKGSAEYRAAMAEALSKLAISKAQEMARRSAG